MTLPVPAPPTAPEVVLPHGGRLRGAWKSGLRVFRGISYAQAPYGARRFQPPVAVPAWHGVRDATDFAPMAPQLARAAVAGVPALGGEGCLALNVWAPEAEPGEHLPVMVWVHGGGFFRGGASDPLYDGAAFARQGIVFVSLQYRLGVDGFLHFEDAPANRGLLDQVAALQWVQDHIRAFGGDPARVTVFGQSAGAGALACLLGMPVARGLFQRVILQSPSIACQDLAEAAAVRLAIAALAGVAPTRDAMAQVPLPAVLHAVHRLAAEPALRQCHGIDGRHFFPLRPVVDGTVLPAPPLQALQQAWTAARPGLQVLVGSNADEMRLYHVPGGAMDRVTDAQLQTFADAVGLSADGLQAYATAVGAGATTPGELLCAVQSDYYYRVPARRIAAMASAPGLQAHLYQFDWASPQWRGRLGAAHAVELPFVFGNLHTPQGLEFTGAAPPQALSDDMHQAWVRFAKQGDPGWPAHAQGAPWAMHFDVPTRCAQSPEPAHWGVWDALL